MFQSWQTHVEVKVTSFVVLMVHRDLMVCSVNVHASVGRYEEDYLFQSVGGTR